MPEKDKRPGSPLQPLKTDQDLYYIANLRRDTSEMRRFTESVVQEADRLRTEKEQSGKK